MTGLHWETLARRKACDHTSIQQHNWPPIERAGSCPTFLRHTIDREFKQIEHAEQKVRDDKADPGARLPALRSAKVGIEVSERVRGETPNLGNEMTRNQRQQEAAVCNQKRVAPIFMLIALNVASSLAAGLFLLRSDTLPLAMATHGALMIIAWGSLLPMGVLVARYFKVTPAQNFPAIVDNPFWWYCHRVLQYSGVALALVALIVIVRETGGHFVTLHGRCGLVVMTFAALQVASPLFRGSKGGPTGRNARPDDARTWRGDHYDMTLRRHLFEAWHKSLGWCLIALSQVTLLLGVSLAGAPAWLLSLLGLTMAALLLAIVDCHVRGRWVDTHEALWGPSHEGQTPTDPRVAHLSRDT